MFFIQPNLSIAKKLSERGANGRSSYKTGYRLGPKPNKDFTDQVKSSLQELGLLLESINAFDINL